MRWHNLKKTIFMSMFVIILFIAGLFINYELSGNNLKFETWFDTKNTFGDGEYQQYNNDNGGLDLFNMKYNCPIINSVTNYIEQNNKVFFKGYIYGTNNISLEVLVVLYLKTNVVKYYVVDKKFEDYMILYSQKMISESKLIIIKNFDEFEIDEQNILNQL